MTEFSMSRINRIATFFLTLLLINCGAEAAKDESNIGYSRSAISYYGDKACRTLFVWMDRLDVNWTDDWGSESEWTLDVRVRSITYTPRTTLVGNLAVGSWSNDHIPNQTQTSYNPLGSFNFLVPMYGDMTTIFIESDGVERDNGIGGDPLPWGRVEPKDYRGWSTALLSNQYNTYNNGFNYTLYYKAYCWDQPNEWVFKSTFDQGFCLDVSGGRPVTGSGMIIWPCHGGENQRWYLTARNELRSVMDPNLCLDVNGGVAYRGARVQVWPCNGTLGQRWLRGPQGSWRSAANAEMCLDINGARVATGTNVQIWDCNYTSAQDWSN